MWKKKKKKGDYKMEKKYGRPRTDTLGKGGSSKGKKEEKTGLGQKEKLAGQGKKKTNHDPKRNPKNNDV